MSSSYQTTSFVLKIKLAPFVQDFTVTATLPFYDIVSCDLCYAYVEFRQDLIGPSASYLLINSGHSKVKSRSLRQHTSDFVLGGVYDVSAD